MAFEASFPSEYRKSDIERLLRFVTTGKFSQLISLPGGGKATVLRLLAYNEGVRRLHLGEQDSFRFVYLNPLELSAFDQETMNKFLLLALGKQALSASDPLTTQQLLKDAVAHAAASHTVVFLFDHFDEYQNKLEHSFYQTLKTLRSLAKYRFTVVFATRRDLSDLVDEEINKTFYDFFVDNAVYMELSDKVATSFILSHIEGVFAKKLRPSDRSTITTSTGGHTKLLKICTEVVLQGSTAVDVPSLLARPIVKATLLEIYNALSPQEQKVLKNVILNVAKNPSTSSGRRLDPSVASLPQDDKGAETYLERVSLLKNGAFTIPLFKAFVRSLPLTPEHFSFDPERRTITKGGTIISDFLSALEFKLLAFLIGHQDRIVARDEVINAVWADLASREGITNQALDQLVFRLRRKIEDDPNNPTHLFTIKGRGFRFVP